ncbi:MAG: response regulator [Oceanicoccus sp.]
MTTILIVEDEKKIADLLSDYFLQSSYNIHWIHNGIDVIPWVKEHRPDLILLDLMLPGKDGISICTEIRQFSHCPVIMITARVDEIDRLIGLELGADDYICKPFSPREVVARAKAVLRRSRDQNTVTSGKLTLDDSCLKIHYHGESIAFTSVEYQLLKLLASKPGHIYSRDQLMNTMYSDHRVVSDRTIDSHIKKIRKKLHYHFPDIEFIHSVYGAGYKFEDVPKSNPRLL